MNDYSFINSFCFFVSKSISSSSIIKWFQIFYFTLFVALIKYIIFVMVVLKRRHGNDEDDYDEEMEGNILFILIFFITKI
jgi:heme/copper-type cytochrome/quinol oxidase subunit 2